MREAFIQAVAVSPDLELHSNLCSFPLVAMEEREQVRMNQKDILSDVPVLKKKLHHIINDLVKVKRMSRFH